MLTKQVGEKCLALGNYNTVMWILDALSSPSVKRLKKIWKEVGEIPFDAKFSPANDYSNYRT